MDGLAIVIGLSARGVTKFSRGDGSVQARAAAADDAAFHESETTWRNSSGAKLTTWAQLFSFSDMVVTFEIRSNISS
jgi:hypothetical protein